MNWPLRQVKGEHQPRRPTILHLAGLGFLVMASLIYASFKAQQDAMEGFTSGKLSIDSHLTEPLVLDASTVLKVDDAERVMVENHLPFCESTCFRAVFKKQDRYYQVSFDVKNHQQIHPLMVEEINELEVKEELLKKNPDAYIKRFGPPQYL